ncbi:hypothetical protein JCM19238_198 [Vibrio ponticus]|nr:hypothetical protein JCM19238_198 [Vibrio ponticus]
MGVVGMQHAKQLLCSNSHMAWIMNAFSFNRILFVLIG